VNELITKELIGRINYLARKQRNGGLTSQEKKEQKELRERYLENIRHQVVEALESAGFKPGNRKHDGACSRETCLSEHVEGDFCGCGHQHLSVPYKIVH